MNIIEAGDSKYRKRGDFSFECKKCECKWEADRGDEGFHILPPFLEFYAYMNCPNCGKETRDSSYYESRIERVKKSNW